MNNVFSLIWFMFHISLERYWFLFLLTAAIGVILRLAVTTKRDYRILEIVVVAGWAICEVIVDIGMSVEIGVSLFNSTLFVGQCLFCFAVGFLLCALVCRLAHRKKLS